MDIVLFVTLVLAVYGILLGSALLGREAMFGALGIMCTISFLFAAKIVNVASYPLVPSAPILAFIFYSGSILQEFYSLKDARKVLWINLGSMLCFAGLGLLVRYMPLFAADDALGQSYDTLLDFYPQALGAALAAFSTSYGLNMVLNGVLHKAFGTKFFPLRSFATVAISNLWDITAFIALAYSWTESSLKMIVMTWLMRLGCIMLGVPVIWAVKQIYARRNIVAVA